VTRLTHDNLSRAFGKIGNPLEWEEDAEPTRFRDSLTKAHDVPDIRPKSGTARTITVRDRLTKSKIHKGLTDNLQRIVQGKTEEDRLLL
jgi:hypothetical protein